MLAQVVLILALLLILVGLIMILLDAFSEGFFWGLLVIFIPIAAPIYCFIKWNKDQARNGFALSLLGIVLGFAGIYGGGAKDIPILSEQEIVKNLPRAIPDDEPLPNEEAAAKIVIEDMVGEYDPTISADDDKFSIKDLEPLAPEEDKTVSGPATKVRRVNIDPANAAQHLNSNVEVAFKDGSKKIGVLVGASESSISLEEVLSGGLISYEYKYEDIRILTVLSRPRAAAPEPVVTTNVESDDEDLTDKPLTGEVILSPEIKEESLEEDSSKEDVISEVEEFVPDVINPSDQANPEKQ